MINFKRTDHVNVCVPPEKLEEAYLFYKNVLGFKHIPRPDHIFTKPGYWFTIAGIEFHVGIEAPVGRTFRHTAFEVNNVTAARQYLESQGVETFNEPDIPGRIRFTFNDPFGNRLELLEYTDK